MLPQLINTYNNDFELDNLYESIYKNIEIITVKYNNILDPQHNNTTLNYLKQGYTYKEAYALSFMLTILLYMNL